MAMLRRTEAVVTTGIIRPLRIAEIEQTVREAHGLQRSPCAAQVGASFHYDGNARCPGDVESKLIRSHTKAAAASLGLRIPEHRWTAAKRRAPACGSRQVVNRSRCWWLINRWGENGE